MVNIKLIESIITWQGEGPSVGQRMLLCRFKYCNRTCPWCDTLVKMRVQQEAEYPLDQIQEILDKEKVGLMITGGEPTLITQKLNQLSSTTLMLNELSYPIANVETNGYALTDLIEGVKPYKPVQYIFSPKFFNDVELEDVKKKVREIFNVNNVYLKIVTEYNDLVREFLAFLSNSKFDKNRVYLMPEGKTRDELLKNAPHVFDMAEKYQFNFSSREHLIYEFV